LILKLLVVDPKKRASGAEVLKHDWFKKYLKESTTDHKLSPEVIASLRSFKGESKLKKAAMNVLVKMLDSKEISTLR